MAVGMQGWVQVRTKYPGINRTKYQQVNQESGHLSRMCQQSII